MTFSADFIAISALQHYMFCPRQCALIHVERLWVENAHTAEGRLLHEKAHSGESERRRDKKTVTGLQLCSQRLGLVGQADVVEFHKCDGVWVPYPVEYKRGRAKKQDMDRVQLCAQALCLEEMLEQTIPAGGIPEGAIFYGKTRRRERVVLDAALRTATCEVIEAVHELLRAERTPPPPPAAPECCAGCSLEEECLPHLSLGRQRASLYLRKLVREL